MRIMLAPALSAALCLVPALAQSDWNTVTVTATQQTAIQPDTAVFQIVFSSGANVTLSDLMNLLDKAGLGNATFSGLSLPLNWDFTLSVPLAAAPDTLQALTAMVESLAGNASGTTAQFVYTETASAEALSSQSCSSAGLIGQATAMAGGLAHAAQLGLGPILAISTPEAAPILTTSELIDVLTRTGFFLTNITTTLGPLRCTMTVRFRLSSL